MKADFSLDFPQNRPRWICRWQSLSSKAAREASPGEGKGTRQHAGNSPLKWICCLQSMQKMD